MECVASPVASSAFVIVLIVPVALEELPPASAAGSRWCCPQLPLRPVLAVARSLGQPGQLSKPCNSLRFDDAEFVPCRRSSHSNEGRWVPPQAPTRTVRPPRLGPRVGSADAGR